MGKFYLNHEKPISNERDDGFIITFKLVHGDNEIESTEQVTVPLEFRNELEKFVLDIEGREPTLMRDYNSFYDDAEYYIENFCKAYKNIAEIADDEDESVVDCISDLGIDTTELIEKYKNSENVYFSTINGVVYTQEDYKLALYVKYSPDTDKTDDNKYAGCTSVIVIEVQNNKYFAVYSTTKD